MNKSLNVFLIVLLCFVLYAGVLTSLYTTDDSASQHYQKEHTSSIPTNTGTPTVSFGVGARGNDLAVPMSSRPSRGSVRHLSSHRLVTSSPNSLIASSPNSLTSSPNSLITYTSSSQTMKSFGGGSNSAGVSMSGGVVSSNATSSPTSFVSMSSNLPSPLAYYPQSTTSFDGAQLTFAASSLQEIGASAVSYDASAPRGIRGRQNANGAIYNSWWYWLSTHNTATGQDDGNGNLIYTYSKGELEDLYESFVKYWSKNCMAKIPGFDEWLSWYISSTGESGYVYNDDTYRYIPVGNIMSLFIFAFIYCGYVYFRIRKGRKINTDF